MTQVRRDHGVSTADGYGRVTAQRRVIASGVVVDLELGQLPFQIQRIPEQHVVKEFSPHGPDQALHEGM